jgi:hypothetical protein
MACGLEKPISRSIPDNSTSDGKLTFDKPRWISSFQVPETWSQDHNPEN